MRQLTKLVEQVLRELRGEYDITVETRGFPEDAAENATDALLETAKYLRKRARDLHSVETALSRLADQLVAEQDIVGLSELGWQDLKSEIQARLAEDPVEGTAFWLETWCLAAAHGRFSALDRLIDEAPLPSGAKVLEDRARTAASGLRYRNPAFADALLPAASVGVEVADRLAPRAEVRDLLAVTRLRLAISEPADTTLVEDLFAEAEDAMNRLTREALQARWSRSSPSVPDEEPHVFTIEECSNIDVAIELIETSGASQASDYTYKIAEKAVGAISLLRKPAEVIDATYTQGTSEIWIAAAERAINEKNRPAFDACLGRAASTSTTTNAYVWGQYYLVRAKGLIAFGDAKEEQAMSYRSAGANFLQTEHLDLSLDCLRKARQLKPDDVDILMTYAEVFSVKSYEDNLEKFADEIEGVIDTFYHALEKNEVGAGSVSFQIAASLHGRLGKKLGAEGELNRWRSLVCSARSALLEPENWYAWYSIGASATDLELRFNDFVFCRRAYDLVGDEPTARADALESYVRGLYNTAQFEQLERLLADQPSEYAKSIMVSVYFALGNYEKTIAWFEEHEITARNDWCWFSAIQSAILIGRFSLAQRYATKLHDYWLSYTNETNYPLVAYYFHSVHGEFAKAAELIVSKPGADDEDTVFQGIAWLFAGDNHTGLKILTEYAQSTSSLIAATLWNLRMRPCIDCLTDHYGVVLPDLSEIDALLGERAAMLKAETSAAPELSRASATFATDPSAVATAKALTSILLSYVENGGEDANAKLLAAQAQLSRQDFEMARSFIEIVRAKYAGIADEGDVPTSYEEAPPDDVNRIQLIVSSAWFEGHNNPVNTHPILTKWLPEIRLSHPDLPSVNIRSDEDFPSGEYMIEIDGALMASGFVADGSLIFEEEAEPFFDFRRPEARPLEGGYLTIEGGSAPTGLADLLHMPPQQYVIRLLAERYREVAPPKSVH